MFLGDCHEEGIKWQYCQTYQSQLPVDVKEDEGKYHQLETIHYQHIHNPDYAEHGTLHISEPGHDFPGLPLVEKTEIQGLDMAVEIRLEIKAHVRTYALTEITAHEAG